MVESKSFDFDSLFIYFSKLILVDCVCFPKESFEFSKLFTPTLPFFPFDSHLVFVIFFYYCNLLPYANGTRLKHWLKFVFEFSMLLKVLI